MNEEGAGCGNVRLRPAVDERLRTFGVTLGRVDPVLLEALFHLARDRGDECACRERFDLFGPQLVA